MVEGDKWEMYIPSELGYGDSGSPPKIQGGDVLVFTMEIIKINGDKVDAIKCDPATNEGCNDKEIAYIEKMKTKFAGDTDGLKGVSYNSNKFKKSIEQANTKEFRMTSKCADY